MKKVTSWICYATAIFLALYDLGIVETAGVDASISAWFEGFSAYVVPIFGLSFLLGHFFSSKAVKDAPPTSMDKWKFYITIGVITTTLWDMGMILRHWPLALSFLFSPVKHPLPICILGIIAGKFLGTMKPVRPAGT